MLVSPCKACEDIESCMAGNSSKSLKLSVSAILCLTAALLSYGIALKARCILRALNESGLVLSLDGPSLPLD